jgi:hypothetical protein
MPRTTSSSVIRGIYESVRHADVLHGMYIASIQLLHLSGRVKCTLHEWREGAGDRIFSMKVGNVL